MKTISTDLNKLRQVKEYRLSDQGGEYTVPCKGADAANN